MAATFADNTAILATHVDSPLSSITFKLTQIRFRSGGEKLMSLNLNRSGSRKLPQANDAQYLGMQIEDLGAKTIFHKAETAWNQIKPNVDNLT